MSTPDEQIVQLLTELRDGQKEQLTLYREVAQRSLDAQQTAIDLQRRTGRLYRIVVSVGAILLAGLFVYLFFLERAA